MKCIQNYAICHLLCCMLMLKYSFCRFLCAFVFGVFVSKRFVSLHFKKLLKRDLKISNLCIHMNFIQSMHVHKCLLSQWLQNFLFEFFVWQLFLFSLPLSVQFMRYQSNCAHVKKKKWWFCVRVGLSRNFINRHMDLKIPSLISKIHFVYEKKFQFYPSTSSASEVANLCQWPFKIIFHIPNLIRDSKWKPFSLEELLAKLTRFSQRLFDNMLWCPVGNQMPEIFHKGP